MFECDRVPARRGKNWSRLRQKPAARCADHISAPNAFDAAFAAGDKDGKDDPVNATH